MRVYRVNILISVIILVSIFLTEFVFISTVLVSLNNQGYNYNSHSYKGNWCDYANTILTCNDFPNREIDLKWNEEYMSSKMNEYGEYQKYKGFCLYFG